MEMICSQCTGDASMAMVNQLTYTVCNECGVIHIAETDQLITMDLTDANTISAKGKRKLFVMAKAMQTIYSNWEDIHSYITRNFN